MKLFSHGIRSKSKKAKWFNEECKEHNNDVKRLLKQYKEKKPKEGRQSYTNANKVFRNLIMQKNRYCKRKAAPLAANIFFLNI